MGLHIH